MDLPSSSCTWSSAALAHCSSRWPPGRRHAHGAYHLIARLDRQAAAQQQIAWNLAQVGRARVLCEVSMMALVAFLADAEV